MIKVLDVADDSNDNVYNNVDVADDGAYDGVIFYNDDDNVSCGSYYGDYEDMFAMLIKSAHGSLVRRNQRLPVDLQGPPPLLRGGR